MIEERYIRNERMLSPEENKKLRSFRVAVVGCGGLGGYLIEMLARLGIGHLTVIDSDVFEASNLNRQLLSLPSNLGKAKATEAGRRVQEINPGLSCRVVQERLTTENADEILSGHDVICDALDNVSSRRTVETTASRLGIPVVFAAIAGWYAQLGTVMPGQKLMDKIYPAGVEKGAETQLGNPSFTPALAASLQVAETLKILLDKEGVLSNKLLMINSLEHEYQVIDL